VRRSTTLSFFLVAGDKERKRVEPPHSKDHIRSTVRMPSSSAALEDAGGQVAQEQALSRRRRVGFEDGQFWKKPL